MNSRIDEIHRLLDENERLRAEDLKSEAAFAERLHAAVIKMKAAHNTERDALTDEIKRLRGALYTVMGVCYDECSCSCAASVVAKRALYDPKEKP